MELFVRNALSAFLLPFALLLVAGALWSIWQISTDKIKKILILTLFVMLLYGIGSNFYHPKPDKRIQAIYQKAIDDGEISPPEDDGLSPAQEDQRERFP